jgi:inositol phosphorylceramide mannosyltransferase catalytic subunit
MLRIPRIFHQIWVGPQPLPPDFIAYQRTWLTYNPGWQLELWTEANLPPDLVRREVYDKLRVPAERADILRVELLWRMGGVYIDTDFECLRPLEGLLQDVEVFVAYINRHRINNAIMGAVPQHPLLDRALKEMRPREYWGYDKAAAGPVFLDKLVRQYPDVTILDRKLFYPATPVDRAGAVAVHHGARSWRAPESFKEVAQGTEKKLLAVQTQLWEVVKELEDIRRLREVDQVHRRLEQLCARITYHKVMPRVKSVPWPVRVIDTVVNGLRSLGKRMGALGTTQR